MKRVHFPDMPPWHAPVPATYCGATADGFVVLTDACGSFAAGSEIPHAIAMQFAMELLRASHMAEEFERESKGLNQWIAMPAGDGQYDVSHRGEAWRFRPIKNGKMRTSRGQFCNACQRRDVPEGATMYVPVKVPKQQPPSWVSCALRLCDVCVRPELAAAAVGASLLAVPEKS